MSRLVLASASPRRLELLRQIGLDPVVIPADIDETIPPRLDAPDIAAHLARQKAEAVAVGLGEQGSELDQAVVLGADTVVEVDWQVLGKPAGPADAEAMLRKLAGRTHHVHTGLWVVSAEGASADGKGAASGGFGATVTTAVTMRSLSDDEIDAYVATGEGADAAGAYAIQGRAALFVTSITGDYSNVVGLPLAAVAGLLAQAGIAVHHQWNRQAAGPDPGQAVR